MNLRVECIYSLPGGGTSFIVCYGVPSAHREQGEFITQLALHFAVTLSCTGVAF